ncbi:YqaE/Pmp3 family membrane protein [Psychrobacillus sp. Sa2BUA9]|uniref:YqaE/Pmp3 family membrane protein n=1 Tax=Psychrobacillus faecigallinarum TaxID=2762235 RepID=A0ABR8RB55_9BACI|nr:YqaE/Pmp3 family membrane protein [Psychrobacillus faecigallinarum]MBD7944752.1 YqaE/Pmp3 family membrane protein [Psychrobacillus faecigallinarum]
MYFLAVFLPPVAVLLSGKPIQALLNFVLTLFFWIPGIIHAVLVVKDNKDNKRMKQQAEIIVNANKK